MAKVLLTAIGSSLQDLEGEVRCFEKCPEELRLEASLELIIDAPVCVVSLWGGRLGRGETKRGRCLGLTRVPELLLPTLFKAQLRR